MRGTFTLSQAGKQVAMLEGMFSLPPASSPGARRSWFIVLEDAPAALAHGPELIYTVTAPNGKTAQVHASKWHQGPSGKAILHLDGSGAPPV